MMAALSFITLSTTDRDAPQFGSRQPVEAPRALDSLISDPLGARQALGRMGHIGQVPGGPLLHTPLRILPIQCTPVIHRIQPRLLLRDFRLTVDRLLWRPDALGTYWLHSADLIGRLEDV
jgi:hypothetical protein